MAENVELQFVNQKTPEQIVYERYELYKDTIIGTYENAALLIAQDTGELRSNPSNPEQVISRRNSVLGIILPPTSDVFVSNPYENEILTTYLFMGLREAYMKNPWLALPKDYHWQNAKENWNDAFRSWVPVGEMMVGATAQRRASNVMRSQIQTLLYGQREVQINELAIQRIPILETEQNILIHKHSMSDLTICPGNAAKIRSLLESVAQKRNLK